MLCCPPVVAHERNTGNGKHAGESSALVLVLFPVFGSGRSKTSEVYVANLKIMYPAYKLQVKIEGGTCKSYAPECG
jgi:hypothetical protein